MKIINKIKRKRILTKKRVYTTKSVTKPNKIKYVKIHREISESV